MDIVFSDMPKISQKNKYWVLTWNGINIPIPAEDYSDVYVLQAQDGRYGFMLKTFRGVLISGFTSKDVVYTDIFSTYDIKKSENIVTPEGIESTNYIFGGSVRQSDLAIMSYKLTPKNLTCREENKQYESGNAIALILKAIKDPFILASVHEGINSNQGWFKHGKSDEYTHYVANILSEPKQGLIYQISYRVSNNIDNFTLPYAIDDVNDRVESLPPKWLESLNSALKSSSTDDWDKYIEYAKHETISKTSIKSTIENVTRM